MIKCALQTNTKQIKHNKLRIPTGGRLTSWLFARRGGVEFGANEDKSRARTLTFEANSQMASTWSRFTSHKCVSTSLGMCEAHFNSHFYLTNSSNMRKCKTAVAINCNKLYNITCIVRGLV